MMGTTAASASSRRRRHTAFAQAVEALEARRLLATVAPGFNTDVLYGSNFSNGTAMDFSPDGRLWATTQNGQVFVIQPGGAPATLAGTITVDSFFERGLLGIAFDPAFDSTAPGVDYVYFYYTRPAGAEPVHNRVVRFEVNGNTIDPASETLILRLNNLSAGNHNGGAIHFGPDGKLYVAVGENAVGSNSQSVNNLLGKMLRINPDPANPIPSDNPATFIVRQAGMDVEVTPTGQNRAIWAVGLRNPYTFAFQPGTGRMHINDVGQSSFEEVNLGAAGANYGWNNTEGPFTQKSFPNFTHPLHWYGRTVGTTIVGGAFYNTDAHTFPADAAGDYFFADLTGAGTHWIRRLDAANGYQLQTTGGVGGGTNFLQGGSSIVDIKVGPDGGVYFLQRGSGNGGQGVRVVRPSDPLPIVTGKQFVFNGFTQPDPPHRLRFSFSEDVSSSIAPDDLTVENLTTGTTIPTASIAMIYEPATNTAVFAFTGLPGGVLPDGRYRATINGAGVTGPTGQALATNPVLNFFFLNGDANRDARVNLEDFNILAANFGGSPRDFTQGDFTYDGVVNLDDFNILAGRFGNVLAEPAATAATTFGATTLGDADREDETDDLLA